MEARLWYSWIGCVFRLQKKLESILAETPEQNGDATFDREAYLREVENFDDVEVVVSGRAGVKIDRKQASQTHSLSTSHINHFSFTGACREAFPSLHPAMGQGLPPSKARLDRGGSLREDRLHLKYKPETSEDSLVSVPSKAYRLS